MIQLDINGRRHQLDIESDTPLLWAIREAVGLTGTKYGCGAALCGACTVHIDGQAVRSCVTPVIAAQGRRITTIEGLDSKVSQAVQNAWEKLNVVQCGYCQPGQIMTASALLQHNTQPSEEDITSALSGNICRCGTYGRIVAAVKEAAATLSGGSAS